MSIGQSNHGLWSFCENYLETSNDHYDITSINRDNPVVYKTQVDRSVGSKIAQIASYFLIVPPLLSLIVSRICRRIYSFDVQTAKFNIAVGNQDCDVLPTKDCKDTDQWRKKLIAVAEHNIVISGNYCGGQAFDELLKAIDLRMSQVPSLKVVLIAHPKFIETSESKNIRNHELINKLGNKYKGRFSLIDSPDGFLGNKKLQITQNAQ